MSLKGIVQTAPPGCQGFDADTTISAACAQQFYDQGYKFCIRYLSLGASQEGGDLSAVEVSNILGAGMALMVVQHVAYPGWSPSGSLGDTNGSNAATNASAIGLPKNMNIWCDLEGVAVGTSAQDVIDYCKAWYDAVVKAEYVPGLYVGANAVLNGQQLYDLPFEHYWRSCSDVPEVAVRGYQMLQAFVAEPVNGIGIDEDSTQADLLGGLPLWLMPASVSGSPKERR